MEKISKIVIVIAMEAEADPLISHLGLKGVTLPPAAPCMFHSGIYKGVQVTVATNGKSTAHKVDNVGTCAATITTLLSVQLFKPDVIINAGTAGGFKSKGGNIGDVYLCSNSKFHDRRIPIPGFTEYGIGNYSSQNIDVLAQVKALLVKLCHCS